MRWIFFLIITTISLSCSPAGNPEVFDSKYVRLANDTDHLMMIDNVTIRFGDLYATADSAFYEKPEKTVTLYSVRSLVFRGKEIRPRDNQTVKYTKGDVELRIK